MALSNAEIVSYVQDSLASGVGGAEIGAGLIAAGVTQSQAAAATGLSSDVVAQAYAGGAALSGGGGATTSGGGATNPGRVVDGVYTFNNEKYNATGFYSDQAIATNLAALYRLGLGSGQSESTVLQNMMTNAAGLGVSPEQLARAANLAFNRNDLTAAQIKDFAQANNINIVTKTELEGATKAINDSYQKQLGRLPTEAEFASALQSLGTGGRQALDFKLSATTQGYNYDVAAATAAFRSTYGRNPSRDELTDLFRGTAREMTAQEISDFTAVYGRAPTREEQLTLSQGAGAIAGFNIPGMGQYSMISANALESDPYAGRFANVNPYEAPGDFAVTNLPFASLQFTRNVTDDVGGLYTLTGEQLATAVALSKASGALTGAEANKLYTDLQGAKTVDQVKAILATPQAKIALDEAYGFQLGQGKTAEEASALAAQIRPYFDAQNVSGYMPNPQFVADAAQNPRYPFGADAMAEFYKNYNTYINPDMVWDSELKPGSNFYDKLNQALSFGNTNIMAAPTRGQYYSETGLQPGFTPFGTEGTTFRSGVAGYTPNLPQQFVFGTTPMSANIPAYQPGAFQPEGVTTGGFITGYDANQQPIYSTYNNPNVNVGGVSSNLIPFVNQTEQFNQLITDFNARQAAIAAAQSGNVG
jgi:hypothetical protein